MNPFTVLGIPSNSSIDMAKDAYRVLAMKYHPDRGGNEAKFKDVKAAWENIERGYRDIPTRGSFDSFSNTSFYRKWEAPKSPSNTWRNDDINSIFDEFKKANAAAPNGRYARPNNEFVANVSLREAFSGFNMVIPRHLHDGRIQQCSINIPPGTPHGYRGKYNVSDGSIATVVTRIQTEPFHLRGFDDADNIFTAGMNIGDIELDYGIDALDLITGIWIKIEDFLAEPLTVRVPAGFNPLHRLKIAGKGYYGWSTTSGSIDMRRQDMYLKLQPIFNKPADIERQKIIDLYNTWILNESR